MVKYELDEYDKAESTVDVDFVDYGDAEIKTIQEVFQIRYSTKHKWEVIWIL